MTTFYISSDVLRLLSSSGEVINKSCDNAKARKFENDHVNKGFGLRSWLGPVLGCLVLILGFTFS